MILTTNILENARKHGIWVDYFTGKPRISGYDLMSNNYRKIHGFPMKRKSLIKQ